jgi:hypothetical protein
MVFVCSSRIYYGIYVAIYHEICHVGKILKNVMVSRNLRQAHLLEVGLMQHPGDHETLSKVRHVGLHVRLFIHEVFFGPLGLHLRM